MWGVDVEEACQNHDCAYARGTTERDRLLADFELRDDLLRIVEKHGGTLLWLRKLRINTYFRAVRMFGTGCMSHENQCTREREEG